jgi:hypothetical protein
MGCNCMGGAQSQLVLLRLLPLPPRAGGPFYVGNLEDILAAMSALGSADRMSVAGMSGSGKTSLVRALIPARGVERIMIYDAEDEYESSADQVCYSRKELERFFGSKGERIRPGREFSVRYVPDIPAGLGPDEMERLEGEEAGVLSQWALNLENCVLLIDEAHNACGQHTCSGYTILAAKRGRKRGVLLWTSSQGPKDVSNVIRKELRSVESWYGRLKEKADLDLVRESVDGEEGKELARRVARLPVRGPRTPNAPVRLLRMLPEDTEPEEWEIIFSEDPEEAPQLVQL